MIYQLGQKSSGDTATFDSGFLNPTPRHTKLNGYNSYVITVW